MATRFDPFREIDRMIDEAFGSARQAAVMPMDLFRTGDHYVIQCDLPGVDPGSVDVSVEDRMLTIRAQRTTMDDADVQWLAKERPVGTFARQISLGRDVAVDDIDANYTNGVLSLTLPITEQARPRRIEVSHGAPASGAPAAVTESAHASVGQSTAS